MLKLKLLKKTVCIISMIVPRLLVIKKNRTTPLVLTTSGRSIFANLYFYRGRAYGGTCLRSDSSRVIVGNSDMQPLRVLKDKAFFE